MMKFSAPILGAIVGLAFFGPAYAADETQKETPAEVQQDSSKAQQQMDDVGEEATGSADEKTEELKKDSENAQGKMDDVGEDALTETRAEQKADHPRKSLPRITSGAGFFRKDDAGTKA